MTNSKPNYRIGSYSTSSEDRNVILGLSLRKKMSQLEDRTFCSCHDQDEAGREYTCCPEGCGCLCDSEDIHDRELDSSREPEDLLKSLCFGGLSHNYTEVGSQLANSGEKAYECRRCKKILALGGASFLRSLASNLSNDSVCICVSDTCSTECSDYSTH